MENLAIVCLLIILLIVMIWIFNSIYMKTPFYLNQVKPVEKFHHIIPENLEIINTGSNHAYFSIDWSLIGVKGFSLASGPQSVMWDYRILKKYRSHVDNHGGGKVLLVLSDLMFGFLEYTNSESDKRYYYFMQPNEIPRYTKWQDFVYHRMPVLANWRNIIHCFYHRGTLVSETEPTLEYAEQQSDLRIAGWKSQFDLKDLQHRESVKHLAENIKKAAGVVRKMVDESRAAGLTTILMIPPLSAVINKKLAPEFLDEVLYKPVRKYLDDVPLLDYVHDERFQDYRLYQNGDFMNEAGRKKFMPVLWQDIQKATGEIK